jgi:hypothetical protein
MKYVDNQPDPLCSHSKDHKAEVTELYKRGEPEHGPRFSTSLIYIIPYLAVLVNNL